MTVRDALDPKDCLTGTFVSTKPLDDCKLIFGFTTAEELPFFISQIKEEADGKYVLKNSIAFTQEELKQFAWFMRRVLSQPSDEPINE